MEKVSQANSMERQRFFAELAPRLDTARTLERELDRNLARRFNVLDYLRTDELGLSRIIADRRIDISVQIGEGDGRYCLAIENKPYAGDQVNQVRDYLEYLGKEYCARFLLIYLSPTGEGPSESSIHKTELEERWKDRFRSARVLVRNQGKCMQTVS